MFNTLNLIWIITGGDGPEAVADGLQQVLKLSWRQEATKMCVFISDAPPHGLGLDSGDGFPNGNDLRNIWYIFFAFKKK